MVWLTLAENRTEQLVQSLVWKTTLLAVERVKTLQLLTSEAPDLVVLTPCLADCPDLSPVDYRVWGSCRSVCMNSNTVY